MASLSFQSLSHSFALLRGVGGIGFFQHVFSQASYCYRHFSLHLTTAICLLLLSLGLAGPLVAQNQLVPQQQSAASTQADLALSQAKALLEKGEATQAEHAVREYLKDHPDSGDAHFFLGYILFTEIQADAQKNPQSHRDDYQPSNQPHANSGRAETTAKASLAEFTEGARHRTPSAFDLKIVALDYIVLGDYADADKWLTRSVQANPQDEQAWYYLGRTKYNLNRFDEAIQAFEKCLQFDPKNVKAEDNLGLAYAGLNRTDDAIAAFKKAIARQSEIANKDEGPYINMGSLLLDQNRTEEALSFLNQAAEISPQNSKAHELLGQAYTRLNKLPLAQSELEKAVSLAPQVASLHCMLGPVYRKQGFTEKAKAEFDRCSALTDAQSNSQKQHR
jgi:tetratricopeptide (TPR) repeat protein